MNELILVDENDNVIGYGEKIDIHRKGLLHRALSVFLYDESSDSFLLQKRALGKYHSGGLWSNSCCSHPYRGESWTDAIARALKNELSLDVKSGASEWDSCLPGDDTDPVLRIRNARSGVSEEKSFRADSERNPVLRIRELGSIVYFSDFGELKEHEYDHVFLCCMAADRMSDLAPNPEEVEEYKWVTVREIGQMLVEKPECFSAWFPGVFRIAESGLRGI